MKKIFIGVFVLQLFVLLNISTAFSQCGTATNDLSITLPCVEDSGSHYKLVLRSYANPADPGWFYWKSDSKEQTIGGVSCAQLDINQNINVPCVYFAGVNISMYLEKYNNTMDPNGEYWKMGTQLNISPVSIVNISGDLSQCFDTPDDDITYPDTSYYETPEFQEAMGCVGNCGTDQVCIMSCMTGIDMGGIGMGDIDMGMTGFRLSFTLNNPGTITESFTLPAGAYYQPGTSDVQPMLLIEDHVLNVDPGQMTFCIPTYCMDSHAAGPSDNDVYSIADIAQQPCITEILDLLKGKSNASLAESFLTIQDAVWKCTDEGFITDEQRTKLGDIDINHLRQKALGDTNVESLMQNLKILKKILHKKSEYVE